MDSKEEIKKILKGYACDLCPITYYGFSTLSKEKIDKVTELIMKVINDKALMEHSE